MKEVKKQEIMMLVDLIKEQTGQILSYKNTVPQIEIDILKEKLRKLYDEVNYINFISGEENSTVAAEAEMSSDVDEEARELIEIAEKQFEEKESREESAAAPLLFDESEDEKQEEEPVRKAEDDDESPVKKDDNIPLKEKAEEEENKEPQEETKEKTSLYQYTNERSSEKTLGENLLAGKIESLKKAISINDKFQIRNELFNGKASHYSKSIETLDSLESYEQAEEYLSQLASEYEWEPENEALEIFLGYIKRRY